MAMNTSQARIINPILSEVARGHVNQEFVGMKLFPIVPVNQRGGKVVKFGPEKFQLVETARAPGGPVARVESAIGSDDYALEQHAISEPVYIENMEDAATVPGIDLGKVAVNNGMQRIGLRREYKQATLARNASLYASTNKSTLSGTSQWSHADSKPAQAIRNARSAISDRIGLYPNVLLLGEPVFAALQENPSIIERIKYTGRDNITKDMLASLFDVDEVVVGKAVYVDPVTGAFIKVWGKDAVLAYSVPGSLASMGTPSYAYTYQLRNHPVVEQPYYDRGTRSWLYDVVDEYSPVMAGADAGFLFTNAVA